MKKVYFFFIIGAVVLIGIVYFVFFNKPKTVTNPVTKPVTPSNNAGSNTNNQSVLTNVVNSLFPNTSKISSSGTNPNTAVPTTLSNDTNSLGLDTSPLISDSGTVNAPGDESTQIAMSNPLNTISNDNFDLTPVGDFE